jgi:hypothetical protein
VRSAATILLIIGLCFGVLGGVAGIALFFFGDTLSQLELNSLPQGQPDHGKGQVRLDRHGERTPLRLASVIVRLPVVVLGGLLGLLGNTPAAGRARARSCGAIAFAAGLVLLLYQGWIGAGAYVVAGVLVFFPIPTEPRQ